MDEKQARKEAQAFVKEAEGHLQSKTGLLGLFSSGPNYYDAVEAYSRAGNVLKAAKCWREAGDAYIKAAETEAKGGEADASARKFLNAASCYKKIDAELAVTCLIKANDIFVKNGRFHIAATHEKEIAEIYETQLQDYPQAIKFYLSAADRFAIDDSVAIAQSCSIKAAMLAANMEDYEKAAGLFEENAESSAHDQLRKYSVKDHLFRAGLCRLCLDDLVGAKRAFARYSTIDYAFSTSKEHELLDSLAAVIETGDVEQFTELVTKWDRTNAMDEWKTRVLLKIKQSMDEEPSLT